MTDVDRTGRTERRLHLQTVLHEHGLGAVVLRRPANFAWYTGGSNNRIDYDSPVGVAEVVLTASDEYVVTADIEALRFKDEETPDLDIVSYPWFEGSSRTLARLAGDARIGADVPFESETSLTHAIDELRWVLDETALAQYRQVGADAKTAMAEAVDAVAAGMTEREAAAALRAACTRRGLNSPVILVAADDRIVRYRHPLPTHLPIERRVMLVACAERGGLYANLTRFVELEEPDVELQRRKDACETILRRLREEATRPGQSLAQVLEECMRFYAEAGYPDEWRLHHQGGLTGYGSRELVATPSTDYRVRLNQAFTWNPSITGAKAEETFLLLPTGTEVVA